MAAERIKDMTFKEIRKAFPLKELSSLPGDPTLRHKAFLPVLADLYESKIVYREKFVCVVSLGQLEIDSKGIRGHCTPETMIFKSFLDEFSEPLSEGWHFGGGWEGIRLLGNALNAPYCGWTIWPEKNRVRRVIELAEAGDLKGACALTIDERI
jgi:hypothetical protein